MEVKRENSAHGLEIVLIGPCRGIDNGARANLEWFFRNVGERTGAREECEMQQYQGRCHCGALGIIYGTEIDPLYWRLRHDGCSFCRRHGVVGTSDSAGKLSVDIRDPSRVQHYRFAHRTADFLLCSDCGVFVAAITDTAQGKRAVINARVLDGVSLNWTSVAEVHFDEESPSQRAERRSLHWTPVLI
jgi:hypothetical protein